MTTFADLVRKHCTSPTVHRYEQCKKYKPSPWEPNPAGKELIELFHKMIRVRHEHEKKR